VRGEIRRAQGHGDRSCIGIPELELCFADSFGADLLAEMLKGPASDVTTSGMWGMTKPRTSEAGNRQLQLLLVGGSVQDFADLRRLLAGMNDGQLHLDHAASPQEALKRFEKGRYDLLLCSHQSTDNTAFQLLRQVRQYYSGVPLIVLSGPVNKEGIAAAIQVGACPPTVQNHHRAPNRPDREALSANSTERQQLESEETLRKLWHSVEQMADALIIMNRSGVMEYVNPAFEGLTGYSRKEAIGQTLGILESEQQAGELYEEMWKTVLSGNVFRGIVMNRKKN
jgi:PAS domain-containing protein